MNSANQPDSAWQPHVISLKALVGTALVLFALTGVTVAVAQIDLGSLSIAVAMAIASIKATLVALVFMHLKFDRKFNALVLAGGIFFTALFIGFVVFDTTQYQPGIDAWQQDQTAPAEPPPQDKQNADH